MHLLLVEDDLDLGFALQRSLGAQGYACTWVRCIKDGRAHTDSPADGFDCVVLDLGLPDGRGIDLLRFWRRNQKNFPVIVLTARDAVASRIDGLDAGADDYVIKPVTTEELASRIRAVTRRAAGQASQVWDIGKIRIDVGRREVSLDDRLVTLSPREFQIVEELARNVGEVVTKHRMARALQPFGDPLEFSTLDWHIHNLRRKLGPGLIQTVRGVGYCLGE
jgi:two-component system, OmpR family, response regulator QseB